MKSSLQEIYERHHREERGDGFSILERERGELLRELVGRDKIVLDLGCRDGTLTRYFCDGNRVTGVDVDALSLARARESLGVETVLMDLNGNWEELGGKTFDVAVAGETLEHLFYPERVLERVVRHLKAGGLFLGSVPNAFNLKNRIRLLLARKENTPLQDPTHVNHFSAPELERLLKSRFSRVEIRGLGRYTRLIRLSPNYFAFGLFFVAQR
ncbi:MAG: class I SAM-dependent methyltransferase [Planctomycetes bacterium]|nr:class I SAM-dependent methyltransferase [Planctomycetota bacterium]